MKRRAFFSALTLMASATDEQLQAAIFAAFRSAEPSESTIRARLRNDFRVLVRKGRCEPRVVFEAMLPTAESHGLDRAAFAALVQYDESR